MHNVANKALVYPVSNNGTFVFIKTLKSKIYNLYIWCLQKLGINMTKSQWYNEFVKRSERDINDLQEYLARDYNDNSGYLSFIKSYENKCEFNIGHRHILIVYTFNMVNFTRHFKTFEITMNENDYGKLKLTELKNFNLSVTVEGNFTDGDTNAIKFPSEYLYKLERHLGDI